MGARFDHLLKASLRDYEKAVPDEPATVTSGKKNKLRKPENQGSEIYVPGVRVVEEDEYKEENQELLRNGSQYISFTPHASSQDHFHFERKIVEYEVDDEDLKWIHDHNLIQTGDIDEEGMEMVMDILEKESFRQKEFRQITSDTVIFSEDDVPCCVCEERDYSDDNLILLCDGCNLAIHQECQDLGIVPDSDWFCDACIYRKKMAPLWPKNKFKFISNMQAQQQQMLQRLQQHPPKAFGSSYFTSFSNPENTSYLQSNTSINPNHTNSMDFQPQETFSEEEYYQKFINPICCLCGQYDGGAFKKTHLQDKLVHIICALMISEVWISDGVANISRVGERRSLTCLVCGVQGGCTQCAHKNCKLAFHATCARNNGQLLLFGVPDPNEDIPNSPQKAKQSPKTKDKNDDNLDDNNFGSVADIDNTVALSETDTPDTSLDNFIVEDDELEIVSKSASKDINSKNNTSNLSKLSLSGLQNQVTNSPKKSNPLSSSSSLSNTKKKKKIKRKLWIPYQTLCIQHSALVRAKRLEEMKKKSMNIPAEIGRFLEEEDPNDDEDGSIEEIHSDIPNGETPTEQFIGELSTPQAQLSNHAITHSEGTTFSKAFSILQRYHSQRLRLSRQTFDKIANYWKTKRMNYKLGRMPFIFQLHVLVSFFKEEFDAGRRYSYRPRQMDISLGQYSPQQKLALMTQLRQSMEALRTVLDVIKKREIKKRDAIKVRVQLLDLLVTSKFDKKLLNHLFQARPRSTISTPLFTFYDISKPLQPQTRSIASSSTTPSSYVQVPGNLRTSSNSMNSSSIPNINTNFNDIQNNTIPSTALSTAPNKIVSNSITSSAVSLSSSSIPTTSIAQHSTLGGLSDDSLFEGPPPKKKRLEPTLLRSSTLSPGAQQMNTLTMADPLSSSSINLKSALDSIPTMEVSGFLPTSNPIPQHPIFLPSQYSSS